LKIKYLYYYHLEISNPFPSLFSRYKWSAKTRPTDIHPLPDARAGEGVPHESLSDQETENRDGARALPDGATDQDLVPEPADEAEERDPGDQGAERAGEAGAGPEGSGGSGCGGGGPRRTLRSVDHRIYRSIDL